MSRRFSPAQPAIGPTDPDSAPARALVLVEDFSAGQGHWHLHRRAQLIHASQGVIHVHTQTGHWVVPPQRAVWIPPNTLHSVGSSWGYRLQTLYLDSKLPGLPRRAAVVPVSPLLEQLLAAVARLGDRYGAKGPQARLVQVMLDQLPRALDTFEQEQLHLPEPEDPRLRRITAAWHADPSDSRDLNLLARAAGLSLRSATRGFLRETGMTPGDWRTQRRMLAAVELLTRGHSVTRVALDVGYGESSSFIAVFRRAFGQTPARWAARLLQTDLRG